jgi:hypothetical protein
VRFMRSSALIEENRLSGEERVIDLCRRVGATDYINPIGGKTLYSPAHFAAAGITLRFLESTVLPYAQFANCPVPALSIIDTLMFAGIAKTSLMLGDFRLS